MFKVFNALEELYVKSKESKTLECTDFLGNIIQCTFDWNMPIEIEELEKIIFEKNLKLPKEYIDFLLMANGAILYNTEEDSGYQLLSIQEAIRFTEEMKELGYDLKEWLIFTVNLFDSDMLLFDLNKIDTKRYIIDGIEEYPTEQWKYLKCDFRIFMNRLFESNGANYWRWL